MKTPSSKLDTVRVPEPLRGLFESAQEFVRQYFSTADFDPSLGRITIGGERYVLLRAASLSAEFFDVVSALYRDRGEWEARRAATNVLYHLAHTLGRQDARHYHARMDAPDSMAKLSAGPIQYAYTGWASVQIHEGSTPTPDDDYFLVYDHLNSFEAESWLRAGVRPDFPVCVMSAGYSSGWCEASFGVDAVAVEIECTARGDEHCRFIMAPATQLERHLARYSARCQAPARPEIPELFERKHLEDALRASEERHRLLLESVSDAISVVDRDGHILVANTAAAQALGGPLDEVVGRNLRDFLSERHAGERVAVIRRVLESGEVRTVEEDVELPTGTTRIYARTYPVPRAHGASDAVLNIEMDVSQLRRIERDLETSRRTSADIIQSIPSGLFIYHYEPPDRLILLDGNPAAARMTGLDIGQARGKEFTELWPLARQAGLTAAYLQVMRTGEVFQTEDHQYVDERLERAFAIVAFLMPDHRLGVALDDITDRKRAELERDRLERQLLQSQKMEAIGTLAGGVAHDMNNVLSAIMNSASMLEMELPPDAAAFEDVRNILVACHRGSSLTRNLLGFARKGNFRSEEVRLSSVVRDTVALLDRTLHKKVRIEVRVADRLPAVLGDPGQLGQALLNVCINGADAMRGAGLLTVVGDEVNLGEAEAAGLAVKPGHYVRLSISDEGHGMSGEAARRAFEPFFTTKEAGKGTGLGLAMVYGTLRNHGGAASIESLEGHGTVVRLFLPALPRPSRDEDTSAHRLSPLPRSVRGVVLLVDDEEQLRESAGRLLRRLGLTVLEARNGREAVHICRCARGKIDVVLLDLVMPELDGSEALAQLNRLDPGLPVVLTSGYRRDRAVESLLAQGAAGFLHKPFSVNELARVLGKTLGRGRPTD